ncbi:DUF485 domain-containing protein [Bacillus thermotolerans]|uniref:DUF485 domain-containing protein n=1 Tax=Bacillus thermotolerans TaxID=1221996 RepID=A0A0F5I2J1_BACTR|nr:DUF485 domain-containing protein [Bacillus thermotolerans]KKB37433.1 hypothetical protein QY97_00288 [Bacillus thermotolerans]KKB39668.1 hypothetical protein QY95_02298 [Bacillus thermotolerans]KKB44518.1 hypothetical protein QY96_02646 [Bacillus thermotolerans]
MSQPQMKFDDISAQKAEKKIPYERLVQTEEFKDLLQKKKSFIIPTTVFFLIFYFTLPLLAAYTKILHVEILGPITGAWIFAGLQFLLVWICGFIYVKKSENYDRMAKGVLQKYRKELSK